jgi:predicted protein tyrosine phosphatase
LKNVLFVCSQNRLRSPTAGIIVLDAVMADLAR